MTAPQGKRIFFPNKQHGLDLESLYLAADGGVVFENSM